GGDKRIGMGRLLATETRTNRTVAEVELRRSCESRGGRCHWCRIFPEQLVGKVSKAAPASARISLYRDRLSQRRTFAGYSITSSARLRPSRYVSNAVSMPLLH